MNTWPYRLSSANKKIPSRQTKNKKCTTDVLQTTPTVDHVQQQPLVRIGQLLLVGSMVLQVQLGGVQPQAQPWHLWARHRVDDKFVTDLVLVTWMAAERLGTLVLCCW